MPEYMVIHYVEADSAEEALDNIGAELAEDLDLEVAEIPPLTEVTDPVLTLEYSTGTTKVFLVPTSRHFWRWDGVSESSPRHRHYGPQSVIVRDHGGGSYATYDNPIDDRMMWETINMLANMGVRSLEGSGDPSPKKG